MIEITEIPIAIILKMSLVFISLVVLLYFLSCFSLQKYKESIIWGKIFVNS